MIKKLMFLAMATLTALCVLTIVVSMVAYIWSQDLVFTKIILSCITVGGSSFAIAKALTNLK